MNSPQRFFLILTLSLLLLGLAAHSAPASLCACADSLDDAKSTSGLDACLVCQLETGAYATLVLVVLPDNKPSSVNNAASLSPLKHAAEIPHPPIVL